MKGGVTKPSKTEFKEFRSFIWKNPYVVRRLFCRHRRSPIWLRHCGEEKLRKIEFVCACPCGHLRKTKIICRRLIAGIGVQVAQQFVGINTVMYYSPTIVQLAGFASNRTALALSLITSSLNAVGTVISTFFVDRTGRRKLILISLVGIVLTLVSLTAVFHESATHSPAIGSIETAHFGNYTCPNYGAMPMAKWNCMTCLKASADCGFCADDSNKLKPGACLIVNDGAKNSCHSEHRQWYIRGCPSSFGWFALICPALYIIFYAPGMGTIPWIVNSEIYPLRYRGACGRIAATANWISNLIVSQTFLSLTEALGTARTFFLFAVFAFISHGFVSLFVLETKGLPFEEVEKMLEHGGVGRWNKGVADGEKTLPT